MPQIKNEIQPPRLRGTLFAAMAVMSGIMPLALELKLQTYLFWKKHESVHWYCEICNTRASPLLPKKFIDAADNISRKQDAYEIARIEDYQQLKKIKESLQSNEWTWLSMSFERKSICLCLLYWCCEKPANQYSGRIERTERDLTKRVSSSQKLTNSIEIKRELAKFFPFKRLVYACNTDRGNIHLEVHSSQEADDVFSSWQENVFGTNTSVRKPSSPEQPNRSVLVRGVHAEIAEITIVDSLAQDFSNIRATRFVKRDNTDLGTVRLTFSSAEDAAKAVNQGLFLTIFSTDLLTSWNKELKSLDDISARNLDTWAQTVNLKKNADTAARNITSGNNHQTDSYDCQFYLN